MGYALGHELVGNLDAGLVETEGQRGARLLQREQGGQLVPVKLQVIAADAKQHVLHDVQPRAPPPVQL